MSRNSGRWVLLLICLGIPLAAPVGASGQTYFHGCGNQNLIEPTEVVLTCADAKLRVEQLEWFHWEGNRALAIGSLVFPDCPPRVPLYRCRNYSHKPVKFKLYQPKYCRHFGVRYFSQSTVIDESAPTPATRVSPFPWNCPKAPKQHRHRTWRQCGDQPKAGAGWYRVRALNVGCGLARRVAKRYTASQFAGNDFSRTLGFSCQNTKAGIELARVGCFRDEGRGPEKVRFQYGA